jgi:hypothetical protein
MVYFGPGCIPQRPGAVEFAAPDGELPVEIAEPRHDIKVYSGHAGFNPHGNEGVRSPYMQYAPWIGDNADMSGGPACQLQGIQRRA